MSSETPVYKPRGMFTKARDFLFKRRTREIKDVKDLNPYEIRILNSIVGEPDAKKRKEMIKELLDDPDETNMKIYKAYVDNKRYYSKAKITGVAAATALGAYGAYRLAKSRKSKKTKKSKSRSRSFGRRRRHSKKGSRKRRSHSKRRFGSKRRSAGRRKGSKKGSKRRRRSRK